jgi:hypothetical protein
MGTNNVPCSGYREVRAPLLPKVNIKILEETVSFQHTPHGATLN